jgi:hypothetical protein
MSNLDQEISHLEKQIEYIRELIKLKELEIQHIRYYSYVDNKTSGTFEPVWVIDYGPVRYHV